MKKSLVYIVMLFLMSCLTAKAQIAVIANKSVSEKDVNISRLLDIYTLNTQFWNGGEKIKVFDLKKDLNDSINNKFYTSLGITPTNIMIIWRKKQYLGKAMPPAGIDYEDEMLKKVAATPNSIGYVQLSKVTDDVKLLYKIE